VVLLANTKKKKTTKSSKKKNTKNRKKKVNEKKQTKNKRTKKKRTKKTTKNKKPVKKSSKKKTKKTKKTKKPKTKKSTEKKINPSKINTKKIKAEEKKDIVTIIILTIIILAIIVFTLLTGANQTTNLNDANQLNTNDQNNDTDQSDIVDTNTDLNLTKEEILQKAQELQTKLNVEIIDSQLEIFKNWYPELGLENNLINECIKDNNYADPDLDIDDAEHLLKITEDTQLAGMLGFEGSTPGIFVNGYKLNGYKDYNNMKEIIEIAKNTTSNIDYLDSDTNTYTVSEQTPKLYVLYNNDNNITKNSAENTLNILENKPYDEFFTSFFEDVEIIKKDYRDVSPNISDVLKTLKVNSLPFFYLDGNIDLLSMDENTLEIFNNLFVALPSGGHIINEPQSQYLDYSILHSEKDFVYGDENAPVTIYVFDDYDCAYCQKLDNEVLPKIIENYVDSGEVNIVIKDNVIYPAQSLFPAVFSRCAQEQGEYWKTHTKLFDEKESFGGNLVQGIFDKYESQITQLQNQYQQLLGNQ